MKLIERLVKKIAKILQEELKGNLLGIVWYGSSARGELRKESDVDFILILKKINNISRIYEKLTRITHKKIFRTKEYAYFEKRGYLAYPSFYVMSFSEFKSHPPLLLDPVYEGKIIFERGKIVSDEFETIRKKLRELGSRREKIFGDYYWILKPGLRKGEIVEI
jgi:predicted nucleotidyltransferase